MSGGKTLVAYVSKGGVTAEAASVTAEVLREKYRLEIDVVNLKKSLSPNLAPYQNIIIGVGVRMQKVYKEALEFLKSDFGGKKVAIFLSSLEAGGPKIHQQAITKYIINVMAKYLQVEPVAAEGFGGRMTILGKTVADSSGMGKVRAWAEELGAKLTT